MAHSTFLTDLQDGQAAELDIITRLTQKLPGCEVVARNNDNKNDFTVLIDGKPVPVECKWDKQADRTRNIAIEIACSQKPSGIYSTQARVYCYKYGDRYRLVTVDALKAAHRTKTYRVVNGGDNNRARMFLMPVDAFEAISIRL